MKFDEFLGLIPKINNLPLPGKTAQFEMAPMERIKTLKDVDIDAQKPRVAAVMSLFYPDSHMQTRIVLILRKTYKGVHSNQVGFPGGKLELEDDSLEHAALRETEEEVGVAQTAITVVKKMTKIYIPPSNFWVHSFVGYTTETPVFRLQEDEVEAVLEVPLVDFLSEEAIISRKLTTSYAVDLEVPAFLLNGQVVWGATAMMLNEIKTLLLTTIKG